MPGKNPALNPAHRKGSAITSYHQCHYHEDHMHSSWVNVGHVLTVKVKGGAHSSSSRISWAVAFMATARDLCVTCKVPCHLPLWLGE